MVTLSTSLNATIQQLEQNSEIMESKYKKLKDMYNRCKQDGQEMIQKQI